MKYTLSLVLLVSLSPAYGHEVEVGEPITLYRNSLLDSAMRIHVATFNAKSGDKYNWDNCIIAARLFQSQPGIGTYFWCEPGKFKE